MVAAEHVSRHSVGEKEISLFGDSYAFPGSTLLEDGCQIAVDHDVVTVLLGKDSCNEYKPVPAGTSSGLTQGFGLQFYRWNNMPHVKCHNSLEVFFIYFGICLKVVHSGHFSFLKNGQEGDF